MQVQFNNKLVNKDIESVTQLLLCTETFICEDKTNIYMLAFITSPSGTALLRKT